MCKVLVIPAGDMSCAFEGESVYVDVRAKRKADRTPERVTELLREMSEVLARHGHKASIRVELYDASLMMAWQPEGAVK